MGAFFARPCVHRRIARRALENENLLVTMPPGYKVGYNKREQKALISEMVPAAETVESWTEMVTVQIYFGLKGSIVSYRAKMEKDWANVCAGAQSAPVGGVSSTATPP